LCKSPYSGPTSAVICLLLLSILPFIAAITAPLLVDERVLFFESRKFIALDPLAPFQLPLGGSGTWRPLLNYLYWLDSGAPAPLSHGINLGLHAVLVWLSWRWMSRLVRPRSALIGAAFFACHGAHVASVGWVAGRADLLMALAVVSALLAQKDGQLGLCMLASAVAVLCKETGAVVLPILLLIAWRTEVGKPRRWRLPLAASMVALPLFVLSVLRSEVASSYWPSLSSLQAGVQILPAFAVELFVPLFRPIGLGHGWRDPAGLFLAVPALVFFVVVARGVEDRGPWVLGLAFAALSLLPVLHVLPNDGGQWYLLLPSLGAGLSWGVVLSEKRLQGRLIVGFIALLALYSVWETSHWVESSVRVDEMIHQARAAREETGEVMQVPPQDPREWPHMGPSLCCGFPFQVFEELPPR
jgi:hypothetical protein